MHFTPALVNSDGVGQATKYDGQMTVNFYSKVGPRGDEMRGVAIILFSLIPFLSCSSSPRRPVSDHYDGSHFFNPTLPERFGQSMADAFKMLFEERSAWPETVKNRAIPRLHEILGPNEIAVTFVNHATFLIQMGGLNILTDPVWSDRASPISWLGPARVRMPGVAFEDLPRIDLILISHSHYDHLDIETLERLSRKDSSIVIVPFGDKDIVESAGFTDVREHDWWESTEIGAKLKITFTPTQHFSGRGLFDRQKSLWGSYMIQGRGQSIFFSGDTGYSIHFSEIRKRLGAPDIALLGIGSYRPRWFMKPIHMNPVEAVKAHIDLGAKQSFAMHFGTFQLSSESMDQPVSDLKQALAKAGVPEERFVVMKEGETRICRDGRLYDSTFSTH